MVFLTIFFLAILIIYPVGDYFFMKKMKRVGINKWRLYGTNMIWQWGSVFILFLFWFVTQRAIEDIYIYDQPLYDTQMLTSFLQGLATSLTIVILVFIFSKKLRYKLAEYLIDDSFSFLLPNSKQERIFFFFVSLTAGICEEIVFRGVLTYYLKALPFELSILEVGIISSVIFGLVHLYQGWKGVLATTVLGFGLYFLFVRTGTLAVPILIHFIIDARYVFLPNVKQTKTA